MAFSVAALDAILEDTHLGITVSQAITYTVNYWNGFGR